MTWNDDIRTHYNSFYITDLALAFIPMHNLLYQRVSNLLLVDILRVFLKKSNPFVVG